MPQIEEEEIVDELSPVKKSFINVAKLPGVDLGIELESEEGASENDEDTPN